MTWKLALLLCCLLPSLAGCTDRESSKPATSIGGPSTHSPPLAEPTHQKPASEPIVPPAAQSEHPAAVVLSEHEKIELLIRSFAELNAVFIRNDVEYPGTEAAAHLRRKWKFAGDRITTARDFIEQLATKSSETGKAYRIRTPDGKTLESRDWLIERLHAIESAPPASLPAAQSEPVR